MYMLMYRVEESYWWYVARRRIVLTATKDILARFLPAVARPRLLDYGCGTGGNLAAWDGLVDGYGLDASADAVEFCRERGLENVRLVDGPDTPQPNSDFNEAFDIVTLLDVLEHMEDDRAGLAMLRRFLKPDGLLVVTVPAYNWLWGGEDEVSHHVQRYTAGRLAQCFRESGFDVVRMTYFNTFLLPVQACVVLFNRLFQRRAMHETNVKPIWPVLNSLLTAIMSAEASLLRYGRSPFGGSVLGIGRISDPGRETSTSASDEP